MVLPLNDREQEPEHRTHLHPQYQTMVLLVNGKEQQPVDAV
jgi:hypothetical protein